MKNYKVLQYSIAIIIMILLATVAAQAQIFPPPPPPPPGGASVPLDPVSWVMLAAGGTYAYRKYRKANTEEEI